MRAGKLRVPEILNIGLNSELKVEYFHGHENDVWNIV